jgi:hypothetical protein
MVLPTTIQRLQDARPASIKHYDPGGAAPPVGDPTGCRRVDGGDEPCDEPCDEPSGAGGEQVEDYLRCGSLVSLRRRRI